MEGLKEGGNGGEMGKRMKSGTRQRTAKDRTGNRSLVTHGESLPGV